MMKPMWASNERCHTTEDALVMCTFFSNTEQVDAVLEKGHDVLRLALRCSMASKKLGDVDALLACTASNRFFVFSAAKMKVSSNTCQ
jgi:hypothetical protein